MSLSLEIANATLRSLSGIRAGTLPITLAVRLADLQLLHTGYVKCGMCGTPGDEHHDHLLCNECGREWPCASFTIATGDPVPA